MAKQQKEIIRYSISFKQKVVREIEQEGLSSYYKSQKARATEMWQEELVIELVNRIRHCQPNIGGKKLYHLLKDDIHKLNNNIGRDKFFNVLSGMACWLPDEVQLKAASLSLSKWLGGLKSTCNMALTR